VKETDAADLSSSCLVAVKSLKQGATPKLEAEFRQEMEVMASVQHVNIVCLLRVVTQDSPMLLVMEYLDTALDHWLEQYRQAPPQKEGTHATLFTSILSQIAAGMAALHDSEIVHRDLAARNILLGMCHFLSFTWQGAGSGKAVSSLLDL
jgi:receptor tyrosine kinase-like orphan receptor 2